MQWSPHNRAPSHPLNIFVLKEPIKCACIWSLPQLKMTSAFVEQWVPGLQDAPLIWPFAEFGRSAVFQGGSFRGSNRMGWISGLGNAMYVRVRVLTAVRSNWFQNFFSGKKICATGIFPPHTWCAHFGQAELISVWNPHKSMVTTAPPTKQRLNNRETKSLESRGTNTNRS